MQHESSNLECTKICGLLKVQRSVLCARVGRDEDDVDGVCVLVVELAERRREASAERAPLARKVQGHLPAREALADRASSDREPEELRNFV